MRKILLINPPYYVRKNNIDFYPSFPLGLGYIASYLENQGYQLEVIDAFGEGYDSRTVYDDEYLRIGLDNADILATIADFAPNIIGISCLFSAQHFALHSMAKTLKKNFNISIVVGGPHISAVPELVMEDSNIDYGVLGEGEHTFYNLMKALGNGDSLENINGIAYRNDSEVKIQPAKGYIEELDRIPFPAWHLFKMEKYLYQEQSQGGLVKEKPFMTILTSRGCPLNCLFCSARDTWGRHIRIRSAENVIAEIESMRKQFGIKELIIVDDNFNYDVDRLNIILDYFIKKKMIIDVPSGVFIPKLNKDILYKMKQANFRRVIFPIESGSNYVLHKIIRKPVNLSKVKELVNFCKEIKLDTMGYFIIGLPSETKKQMKETYKLIKELKITSYFSIATPFPGSDLYKLAKDKGLLNSYDIEKCSNEYNISTSDWSTEELNRMVKRWRFRLGIKARLVMIIRRNIDKLLRRML